MKKMMMLFAAGTMIGALALRPKCADPVVSTTAATPRVAVAQVPEPVAIASYAAPEIAQAGRNVFAFGSVEDRRSRLSRREKEGQARVPFLHRDDAVVVPADPPRAPEARYLGAFGPQEKPILVFKQDGEVVNVPLRKP
jgi:hypothetical protein